MSGRHAWIDASAGVAGDMLLGALLDAGADISVVQAAIDAVAPDSVRISTTEVTRAGLRARKAHVAALTGSPPHRTWASIRTMLTGLDQPVRDPAISVFARLAEAEARVHGVAADDVHFHEVGALDSIADVIGVCAALHDLGITSVSCGAVAVGSGHVRGAHGRLPVPVPAVAELSRGWQVFAGGDGELATPTGMALVRALAEVCEHLPPMTLDVVGVGAGGRDLPDRANVVRVLVGAAAGGDGADAVLVEANVDDLDPRLWPGVLAGLLELGAADAWLTPIVMKKGRPAHTLSVLCAPATVPRVRDHIFENTTTLGVRESPRRKTPLERLFVTVEVPGGTIAVKVGHRDGVILQAMPEFDEVTAVARAVGRPERVVLQQALSAAAERGLVTGNRLAC
ncbi:nickel pincer cofactor biosynthesis protein LarC [Actinoplanes subglobosus]|uniref:Pyridinium-3,5-bisthiocarboxylic acid mononucleotide nickel insertion protein n=1 Tax=Actinoplanes subglobosus TaxID=1547892 RepID=A0ABV8JBT0_9ACTN